MGIVLLGLLYLTWYIFRGKITIFLRENIPCIKRKHDNRAIDIVLKISNVEKIKESNTECCICLEKGSNKFLKLKCDHLFHEKCIKNWIEDHNTCPICREDIITI